MICKGHTCDMLMPVKGTLFSKVYLNLWNLDSTYTGGICVLHVTDGNGRITLRQCVVYTFSFGLSKI